MAEAWKKPVHTGNYDIAGNPNNDAGVNTDTCERHGEGFSQLCATWRDPDFNSALGAVYYARVLENPSCRWSQWDCLSIPEDQRPATCFDKELPKTIQERAWTSPIWVVPGP